MEIQELWVEQAVSGDLSDFSKIYECIYKEMYRYAYFMLGDVHDAEDVVSDAVMDIYTGLKHLRNAAAFKQWSFKILANKCRRMRKQYIRKNVSIDDEKTELHLSQRETDLEQQYDIERALGKLKQEEREVIVLSVIGGYSSDEVGRILNMKPSTARSKLKRSLTKIKKKLEIR